jgi:branched-chain amino acid aminotransferase
MKASVEGQITDLSKARLPLADHGLLYGDSVYETMRSFAGEVFEVPRHLQRLRRSAAGVYLDVPWTDKQLTEQLEHFRTHLEGRDHYLRLLITRGCGEFSYVTENQQPRLILYGGPLPKTDVAALRRGIRVTVAARRRNPISSLSPGLKTGNLLNPRLAAMEARQAGFDDAILCNLEGQLAEGTTSNLFLVFPDGTLATPSPDSGLLEGITRAVILELATRLGLTVEQRRIELAELERASEVFFCSSTRSVAPVCAIDARSLATPGPVTERLMQAFIDLAGDL